MAGANEEYMKARRSGAYTHPEQKKVFEEGPVISETIFDKPPSPLGKSPSVVPDFDWKKWGLIAIGVFLAVTAYRWYAEQPKELTEAKDKIEEMIEVLPDKVGDLFTETRDIKVEETPLPQPKYDAIRARQDLAFEKLKAWERLTERTINKFYSVPIQPGYKRTLCISVDGDRNCRTIKGKSLDNGLLRRH